MKKVKKNYGTNKLFFKASANQKLLINTFFMRPKLLANLGIKA
jgi:hypothetical protein